MSSLTEYLPTYLPQTSSQWVYNADGWAGQANSCVAATLGTIKEIHHYRRYGTTTFFSNRWIFGNRHSQDDMGDDGMLYAEALEKLRSDGVPAIHGPIVANRPHVYSDITYYDEYYFLGRIHIGARNWVLANYDKFKDAALRNRISQYVRHDTYQSLGTLPSIKNSIIANGAAMLTLNAYDDFYYPPSNGVIPDYMPGSSARSVEEDIRLLSANISGSDGFEGSDVSTLSAGLAGGSLSVPTVPVDPPPTLPPTPGYNGPADGYGHSMAIIGWCKIGGYDYWICHNSWEASWAAEGRCYIRVSNPAIWSVYTFGDGPVYPQPVYNLSALPSSNEASRLYVTWGVGAHTTQYRVNYRVRGSATWIDAGFTTNTNFVLSGLEEDTYYEIKVYGQNSVGNGDPAELLEDNAVRTRGPRPLNWQWQSIIAVNSEIRLSAAEWNAFLDRIELFREWNAPATTKAPDIRAVRGSYITAAIYNNAKAAIQTAGSTISVPSVQAGTVIQASHFVALRDALNAIQ